ncbi:basic leucine zipper 61-like isoform X1 [Senna tora]|uniref:Basic leucine zipper 61-like isoform X1 n=1 Tax=Senna tora TaxID=362788 RepID=A0A834WBC2_9FABA|nr:basic leucine zipper 61-like isoform X1 [Senna tora]
MEGSSSHGKRIGGGLPPIGPRSNRRRSRQDENPNNVVGRDEENIEIAAAEVDDQYSYVQLQPHHQVGGGEMTPTEAALENSRLANRRYSETYRQRRQNHLQYLETQHDQLQAEIAHNTALVENYNIQKSMLEEENAFLKHQIEVAATDIMYKEGETEVLRSEIARIGKRNSEGHQELLDAMSNPNFYDLHQAYMNTLVASFGNLFPFTSSSSTSQINNNIINPPTDQYFGVPLPPHHQYDPNQPGPSGGAGGHMN